MTVAMLSRKIYSLTRAAKILGVHSSTLRRWLDGETRGAKSYAPILRTEATGDDSVTWAEFVEAGWLCQYRRKHGVALRELRDFIDRLRDEQGTLYPLVHHKPWIGPDQHLLLEAQKRSGLPGEFWLVVPASGQLLLTSPADSFLERVEWNDGVVDAWRPHADPKSPVRCRPAYRSGRPAIQGISTLVIAEHCEGGEDEADVAEQFGLNKDQVGWARAYELSRRTLATAA